MAPALTWQNLSFSRTEPTIVKVWNGLCACCCPITNPPILEGLNGSINLGQLTALMGPSGAGKSTLLKCITGGKTYSGCGGKILVRSELPVRACFITQDESDHLLMNLTVAESLRYACKLKNSMALGVNYEEIINSLLTKLDLVGVKDNLVEKCSGGQKKRLAIGLELTAVDKPNFLFLDEPTSGLDSFAGLKVIQLLQTLARDDQMAIVTTIHQPSFKMLSLFHNIYILTKAGKCIYSGPPDQLENEIKNIDPARITKNDNPGDIIIEIASTDKRENHLNATINANGTETGNGSRVNVTDEMELICNQMAARHIENTLSSTVGTGIGIDGFGMMEVQEHGLCKNSANFGIKSLWYLWLRTCITSITRQKRFILIRFALHAIVALVLAALYNRGIGLADGCFCLDPSVDTRNCSCIETEAKLREESITGKNVKFQFFSLLFLMFAALMPTVLTFPSEIKIFLNEHRNGWYTTFSYYFSKTIAEIPLQFIFPFFYTYFLYWYTQQVDMNEWYDGFFGFMPWRYSYFLVITILCCFVAQGLGFFIGILCVDSFNITIIVSSSTLLFLFLFSGFFVKTSQMAGSVEWITYFSFIRFSFESLLIILYGFKRCGLTPPTSLLRVQTQPAVLFTFNLKDEDLTENLIWLIAHLIIIRFLAFLVLKIRSDPKFVSSIIGLCTSRLTVQDTSNSISPQIAKVCRGIGTCLFFSIKWGLIILTVQFVLGLIFIIVEAILA